jgi:hypothetical protein
MNRQKFEWCKKGEIQAGHVKHGKITGISEKKFENDVNGKKTVKRVKT